jgi:uncharacterized protein
VARAEADILLHNVAAFGRVLRASGLEVGPQRLETALRGLDAMGLASRETVYWTLFCTLVSRREQAATFDVAFSAFWDSLVPAAENPAAETALQRELGAALAGGEEGASPAMAASPNAEDGEEEEGPGEEADELELGVASSPEEQLRHVDFSRYGPAELRAARRHLEAVWRAAPRRRSRRLRAASSGRDLDRRRTMRAAMRTEGHPVERSWQERRLTPRRLIFLIDVSGSMEPYARALVLFAQIVRQAASKVEVFTFGTRLTRITAELGGRDPGVALTRAGRAIPDWAGGTRIGDSVKAFNDTAGRRGLTRGAVVVLVSDGCERGEAMALAAEMERLQRAAHSVVWVNPLAGDPAYRPLQSGMLAALPYVDVFLPGHDLSALESLAGVLEAIPVRRLMRAPSSASDTTS